jgi:hypothetical protein
MFRRTLLSSLLALIVLLSVVSADAQFLVDPCKSRVVANAGVLLACPQGDGDFLTNAIGGTNCQITLTVKDNANQAIPGMPETDMWLVGCNNELLICGVSSGTNADHPTDAAGQTTFSRALATGGCSTGVWVVVAATVIQNPTTCTPLCVPIQVRSVDYKSVSSPCAGDLLCPDSQVTLSDWSWFTMHYPTAGNPGASYFPCADFAAPLGTIGLPELSRFTIHYSSQGGHKCVQ